MLACSWSLQWAVVECWMLHILDTPQQRSSPVAVCWVHHYPLFSPSMPLTFHDSNDNQVVCIICFWKKLSLSRFFGELARMGEVLICVIKNMSDAAQLKITLLADPITSLVQQLYVFPGGLWTDAFLCRSPMSGSYTSKLARRKTQTNVHTTTEKLKWSFFISLSTW